MALISKRQLFSTFLLTVLKESNSLSLMSQPGSFQCNPWSFWTWHGMSSVKQNGLVIWHCKKHKIIVAYTIGCLQVLVISVETVGNLVAIVFTIAAGKKASRGQDLIPANVSIWTTNIVRSTLMRIIPRGAATFFRGNSMQTLKHASLKAVTLEQVCAIIFLVKSAFAFLDIKSIQIFRGSHNLWLYDDTEKHKSMSCCQFTRAFLDCLPNFMPSSDLNSLWQR